MFVRLYYLFACTRICLSTCGNALVCFENDKRVGTIIVYNLCALTDNNNNNNDSTTSNNNNQGINLQKEQYCTNLQKEQYYTQA